MLKIGQLKKSSRLVSIKSRNTPSEEQDFSSGELLEGRIIKRISQERYLVDIKGKTLSAQTSLLLDEGMKVMLQVMKLHPLPILKILDMVKGDNKSELSTLIKLIRDNPLKETYMILQNGKALSEDEKRLMELIEDVSERIYSEGNRNVLKDIFRKIGFNYEKRLKELIISNNQDSILTTLNDNIKGIALRLLKDGLNNKAYQELNSLILNVQLLNITAIQREGIIFLLLPMLINGNIRLGQLLIDTGKKETSEEKGEYPIRVLFLLEMSNLGPIKAELSVFDRRIRCIFFVSDSKVRTLLDEELDELKKRFIKSGFIPEQVQCIILKEQEIIRPLFFEILKDYKHTINIHI